MHLAPILAAGIVIYWQGALVSSERSLTSLKLKPVPTLFHSLFKGMLRISGEINSR